MCAHTYSHARRIELFNGGVVVVTWSKNAPENKQKRSVHKTSLSNNGSFALIIESERKNELIRKTHTQLFRHTHTHRERERATVLCARTCVRRESYGYFIQIYCGFGLVCFEFSVQTIFDVQNLSDLKVDAFAHVCVYVLTRARAVHFRYVFHTRSRFPFEKTLIELLNLTMDTRDESLNRSFAH